MRYAFQQLLAIKSLLVDLPGTYINKSSISLGVFEDLRNLLEITISECQPALIRKGEVIASGYNIDLDELRITEQGATD